MGERSFLVTLKGAKEHIMDIIQAAEILNIKHDADHLVIKAAYHALGKKHHPDHGGDTPTMQRINAAHDYLSTRTQAARKTEWERLQKPMGYSGRLDDLHGEMHAANRKAEAAKAAPPRYTTTRAWTPPKPSMIEKYRDWKRRQTRPVRWLIALMGFLIIMAGRIGWLATIWYGAYLLLVWAIGATEQALGVLGLFVAIFGGAIVAGGLGIALFFFSINFLFGGWKGLSDYLNDRHPDPLAGTKYAKDRYI